MPRGAGFRIAEVGSLSSLLEGEALGDVGLGIGEADLPAGRNRRHLDGALPLNTGDQREVALIEPERGSGKRRVRDAVLGQCTKVTDRYARRLYPDAPAYEDVLLGQALARVPSRRVRELSEEDRLVLLRLTEQVTQIADKLDRIGSPATTSGGAVATPAAASEGTAFRFDAARPAAGAASGDTGDRLVRAARAPLPDPRLVRRIIRQRQLRSRFFDGDLFADPAWDMLLDLTAARAEHTRVSVTSLCIASGVPPTTALRWIGQMTEAGLLQRIEDETDRRRAFITMTDKAADGISRYFAELGTGAARLV